MRFCYVCKKRIYVDADDPDICDDCSLIQDYERSLADGEPDDD